MNKKTIIQLVVIVGAFSVAGVVLYNGFFKGKSSAPSGPSPFSQDVIVPSGGAPVSVASGSTVSKMIPSGSEVDNMFKVLNKQDLKFGFPYPKVDFKTEVGKPENQLIETASSSPNTRR